MKKPLAVLSLLSGLLVTGYLVAGQSVEAVIKQSLSRAIPAEAIDHIVPSPLDGISEVLVGMNVFYVSNDGKYVFEGKLIDMTTRTNLTETVLGKVRKQAISAIDEKTMIVFPAKNERHVITVFTDIDCGYCRKLHNEIGAYNAKGITVRYLSFPRSGPDTPSYDKAVSVWCADDRNMAMTSAKSGAILPAKDCANPIKDHLNIGVEMGVTGTPAIVMESGVLLPGYLPARKLADELDGKSGKRS
ncbi:MAG: thioredoxin fold domain-containing protein [Gammaproteobacteria bacterium]|nr:thioredoxin fold domain-containing protein [Gammaproteobacteria bacterium]